MDPLEEARQRLGKLETKSTSKSSVIGPHDHKTTGRLPQKEAPRVSSQLLFANGGEGSDFVFSLEKCASGGST
jgi:hypothetical protein